MTFAGKKNRISSLQYFEFGILKLQFQIKNVPKIVIKYMYLK